MDQGPFPHLFGGEDLTMSKIHTKAIDDKVRAHPEIIKYCKENLFRGVCPECPYDEFCQSLSYIGKTGLVIVYPYDYYKAETEKEE